MATGVDLNPPVLPLNVRFNWVFLIELIVCGVVTIFFLFYFNRGFARLISFLLRLYLRWLGNPHYLDIQSLQISLLAGRIFFGKITYHGPNETIVVVGGQITWRYWLRRVRDVRPGGAQDGEESEDHTAKLNALPCRILLEMKGLEWFVYNRAPQYDWIMNEMAAAAAEGQQNTSSRQDMDEDDGSKTPRTGSTTLARGLSHITTALSPATRESFESFAARSPYLKMLPVKVECNRGAVIMGNNNTPSVLVAHFEKAQGIVDARKSRSIDQYKQVFDLTFTHPVVQLKQNANFKETLLSRGAREQSTGAAPSTRSGTPSQSRTRQQKIRDLFPFLTPSLESFMPSQNPGEIPLDQLPSHGQWMGLSRYRGQHEPEEGLKFEPEEYAMVTDVLDCPSMTLCLYWDVVGTISRSEPPPQEGGKQLNGFHPAPEFGVDISFMGGTVNYGPWADRQRIHLQNMFFPRVFKTAEPSEPLVPGDERAYTEMKVYVELSSSTILRVPIRESSKDWKHRRRLEEGEVRPNGWVEIKVGAMSTLNYNMAYVASSTGWTHTLGLELRNPEVRSSVNHGILWEAQRQTLQCDLSGPLQWNAETKWIFNNVSSGMRVFLLREHVTLITDLVTDWTSGPAQEYWTFVPMIYELNLQLEDTEFFLNVNDQNIINNSSSFQDNTFIVLRSMGGRRGYLKGHVNMDFREFRPQSSTVEFSIEAVTLDNDSHGRLELGVRTPTWNTWNCSLGVQDSLGTVEQVKLKGSYEFYSEIAPGFIDTLVLDLSGVGLDLTLHGFLIRYFLTIKGNYFGEDLHFKTLEEWQDQQQAAADGIAAAPKPPLEKSNDLEIVLGIRVKGIVVLLPKHIFTTKENLKLDTPALNVDMRFTNYYMDLQVDLAPISASVGGSLSKLPEVFIDGLTIFGHRLFGLPPTEPTYVCNWDLGIGAIDGECSLGFMQTLMFSLKAFIFSFKDTENALPLLSEPIIHDVTFIRLNVGAIRLWLHMQDSNVFRLCADEISFVLNDLADEIHSERIIIKIPGLNMACMDLEKHGAPATKGYLDTEVSVAVLTKKIFAASDRQLQQKHIRESDHRTGRANFLLADEENDSISSSSTDEPIPASMALPGLPPPLYDTDGSVFGNGGSSSYMESDQSSRSTKSFSLRHKSSRSFLTSTRSTTNHTGSSLRAPSSHAPSFYSAVESFSDLPTGPHGFPPSGSPSHTNASGSRGSLCIPTPTTKGFRHLSLEMTSRPLGVTLSSPFTKPRFPLDDLEPNLSKVPKLKQVTQEDPIHHSRGRVEMFTDEDSSRDSIIVEFLPGIRGFCTASVIKEVANMLEQVQPQTPDDVLDYIQINVVSVLAEVVKKADQHGNILEACLRLPQLIFCFVDDYSRSAEDGVGEGYSLGFQLQNLMFSGRSRKEVKTEDGRAAAEENSILSVHVLVDSIDFTMTDLSLRRSSAQHALGVAVKDLVFWASSSETSTASLQMKSLATSIEGYQAMFLYDAVLRTATLVDEIAAKFSTLASFERRRIQHFISGLATAGEVHRITQDPATLTRPSYVLRSATNHVRLNDSWKITARLRHIWQMLPDEDKELWTSKCVENSSHPRRSAKDRLIAVFHRWRGWELGNIKDSVLIKQVFGEEEKDAGPVTKSPFSARLSVDSIALIIDPGPSQDEFVIDQLNGSVVVGNPPSPTSSVGNESAMVTPGVSSHIVVHVHSRSIRLGARWEIIDTLEAVILGLRDRQKDVPAAEPTVSRAPSPPPMISLPSKPKDRFGGFHLIFTADHGSLSLDTVNLRVVSMVQDVKASAVLSEKAVDLQGGKFGKVGSLLLRADYGTLEMCHGNKILSKAVIRTLNLYGYFDEHWISETKFHIWKLTGSSEEISIDVREQVLGLMEVVDLVATDELSHIRQLMDNLEDSSPTDRQKPQQNSPTLSRRNVHMVYCTLALDRFSLRAMLMPSLAYMMRGGGARLSARPNSKNSEEMIIDLGLEQHEYEVCKSVESAEPRVISLLRLPAIHASLRDQNSDEERVVEAAVTVEAVTLEASSIQSLLNAIKKPEVLKLIENARDEWSGISAKLESLVGRKGARPLSLKPEKRLVYRAHAGVSSVKIETLAPSANLEVNLGFIQVHASNKSPGGTILSFPEIRLEFGRITVELSRITGDVRDTCGFLELHASLHASSNQTEEGSSMAFYIKSHSLRIELFAETASTAVDVVGHLQDKLRDLDLSREVKYLRKLRTKPMRVQPSPEPSDIGLFSTAISMDMNAIQVAWIVGGSPAPLPSGFPKQNLVLSFKRIHLSTATRKSNEANLVIEEFLLQMVDANARDIVGRSEDSALMPEVTFKVAYSIKPSQRRLAFRVKGTSLDLRLTSSWVVAASSIETSITTAVEKFRDASSSWKSTPTKSGEERTNMFTTKRLASVLVDADFAGAIVHLGSSSVEGVEGVGPARAFTGPERFGQHAQGETSGITVLKSPGLAFKAEYSDPVVGDPSLMAEIKISASDNTLYPSVVPLIMEISENIKEMMKQPSHTKDAANKAPKEASLESAAPNPVALLGRCRLNVGLRICKQEFTLSCQPIARVAASTQYDQIYATFSTCDDAERGRFYSLSATVTGLGASLRHVYSRESAGSLEVGSATLSLMSSKDVMGAEGLSFMVGFSPIKSQINIKQFQDFLLFREIWFPASLRTSVSAPLALSGAPSPMLVQRYHKVAATNAFPWNTTVAIAGLEVQLDLGQSIGKSVLLVSGLWVTSRKTSDWEQVMCLGFDSIRVSSTGRLSGYIDLGNMNVRTSINWDSAIESMDIVQTPLIEASVGFKLLQAKISFDYQAFLIADISGFNFLMYNLKDKHGEDRLVGVLDGDRVQVYCTTQSAAQGLGVYQAFERLYQDKMTSLEASLKEVESFLTRRGATHPLPKSESIILSEDVATANLPPPALFKLYTDVVVNLKEVHLGAFPNTFYDSSIFKLEALNITARFAVKPKNGRIHSTLEMALGQLSVALTPVKNESAAVSSLADVDAEKVIQAVAASKLRAGNKGIILRVPQVTARMETWHSPGSMVVDYSFKSAFEGQVDVGWNFARVSTIKNMYHTHAKAFALRQGKAPVSSRITMYTEGTPTSETSENGENTKPATTQKKGKITAVVDVPQSKYEYRPVDTPVIETPQLRDMGEATPPMEWIGLHREKLPHLTHQIVIVSLLEVAREVEDAYSKILGSS